MATPSKIFTFKTLLLLLITTISFSSFFTNQHQYIPVMADNINIIDAVCRPTSSRETCKKCISSDPRSRNSDKVEVLACIAIECVITSAGFLKGNMSMLAAAAPDASTKEVLVECGDWFSCAESQLRAATLGVKVGDYRVASLAMNAAGVYRSSCTARFQRNNSTILRITEQLDHELVAYDGLLEAASNMIDYVK